MQEVSHHGGEGEKWFLLLFFGEIEKLAEFKII
jgi:hypothetical protein